MYMPMYMTTYTREQITQKSMMVGVESVDKIGLPWFDLNFWVMLVNGVFYLGGVFLSVFYRVSFTFQLGISHFILRGVKVKQLRKASFFDNCSVAKKVGDLRNPWFPNREKSLSCPPFGKLSIFDILTYCFKLLQN